jgi:hypothetical protein
MDDRNIPVPTDQLPVPNPVKSSVPPLDSQPTTLPNPPKATKKLVFITLTGLLLVVLIALAIYSFRYFTNTNPNTKNNSVPTKNGSSTASNLKGYKEYKDANFSLMYPDSWQVGMSPISPKVILIASPDYKQESQALEANTPASNKGYVLALQTSVVPGKTDAKAAMYESTLDFMKSSPESYTNVVATKIDSNEAIQAQYLNTWVLNVFKGDSFYFFSLAAPDKDKVEVEKIFRNITQSIQFK